MRLQQLSIPPDREPAVENALIWAWRNGYAFGAKALDLYCDARGLRWKNSWDGFILITEEPEQDVGNIDARAGGLGAGGLR